jgi:CheY-like chemotaxis protein
VACAATPDPVEDFTIGRAHRAAAASAGIALALTVSMPSILIADDCAPVALIIARHVHEAGYQVSLAKDGAEALALLKRKPIDCILLDLMMPTMTGMELLHHIKQNPALSRIPVVLVSASVGVGRSHVFAERDADMCVGKPFTRRQILDAVRDAMRTRTVGN